MSDELAIALVSTLGVVLAAGFGYLGVLAQQTKKLTQEAKNQVTNSHETNLRDDVTAIATAQAAQGEVLGKLSDNQDHITQSLGMVWDILGAKRPGNTEGS